MSVLNTVWMYIVKFLCSSISVCYVDFHTGWLLCWYHWGCYC